jgi:ubiquinone/menaquinone biosynthesis C-methylase UbiE
MEIAKLKKLKTEIIDDPFFGQAISFALNNLGDIDGKMIVYVGCVSGAMSIFFALQGATVVGIDINDNALEKAKKLALQWNVENKCMFLNSCAESIPIDSNSIDIIFSKSTIQYMKRKDALAEYKRILKSDGTLVLIENLPFNPFINIYRLHRKLFSTTPEESRYIKSILGYLTFNEINDLKNDFDKVTHKEYHLFSMFAIYLIRHKKYGIIKNILILLTALDNFLFDRIYFMRYLAWFTAIVYQDKKHNR